MAGPLLWPLKLDEEGTILYNMKVMRGRAAEARRAHNPEVVGSNPTPATYVKYPCGKESRWLKAIGFSL